MLAREKLMFTITPFHPKPLDRKCVCAKVREIRGSTYAAEVDNYEVLLPPLLLRRSTGREKKRAAEKFTWITRAARTLAITGQGHINEQAC